MNGLKEKTKSVKKVLKEQDIKELEGILKDDGFTENIDPLTLPGLDDAELGQVRLTAKYRDLQDVRMLVEKHGRPLTLLQSPDGIKLNADLTDYIQPYTKGFVRSIPGKNLIAGYGILEEIFIDKLKKLEKPHHFFFIAKHKEKDNLATLLIAKGRDSPCNPANCEEGGFYNYMGLVLPISLLEFSPLIISIFLNNGALLGPVDNFVSNHFLESLAIATLPPYVTSAVLYKRIYGSANVGTYARSKCFNSDYGWKSYRKFMKTITTKPAH